jgi:hypothetical protein
MPTKVRFSREDLLIGRLLEPGWYPMKVKKIEEKAARKDGSTNWIVSLENTLEGQDQGVVVRRWFNEKAVGFMKDYLEAFGIDVQEGTDYDIYQTEGEMVEVYIERGKIEGDGGNAGQPTNVAQYFRPIGSGAATT